MGKIRRAKDAKYSIVAKEILWDKRLSVKARFILIFCLSLADGWEYNVNGLATSIGISNDSIIKGLKELEQNGYLERKQLFDERKKFAGYDYVFYEESKVVDEGILSYTEKSNSTKTYSTNQQQLNNKELNNKELNTKDNNIIVTEKPDAVQWFMEHIHPTPSSSLVEKINDLANDVGLSIFKEACEIAEHNGKRNLAYVEGVAMNIKAGNVFEKKPQQNTDYWSFMLEGVKEDGDKQE